MFNNNKLVLNRYELQSPKITGSIRLAHLSDLHEKRFGDANSELFNAVSKQKPDAIMVTGDLVAHEVQPQADIPYTRELAQGLSSIAPTFFVTGNHERRFDAQIKNALLECGVNVLAGGKNSIESRGNIINIGGIDDLSYGEGPPPTDIFKDAAGYNIFLSHQPQVFPRCVGQNIDLVLCGHTHAGQIRIPFFSRLYMGGQGFFPKYMHGRFTEGDTTMIVSRGLGASGYPTFRFNNPPDLVIVDIRG